MYIAKPTSRVSFGLFEADLSSGELWRGGFRIKLQSQPFKVLAALLLKSGELVTREELQELVWGKDTTVDFDHSLGTNINKIREALSDSAENPRFIETLTRRGYRFIAPVTVLDVAPPATSPPAAAPAEVPDAFFTKPDTIRVQTSQGKSAPKPSSRVPRILAGTVALLGGSSRLAAGTSHDRACRLAHQPDHS